MMRVMALDVGDARIGVAVSDPLGITAQPLSTIERKDGYLSRLLETITSMQVKTIVIGLPLTLEGEKGPQVKKVENFKKKLGKALRAIPPNGYAVDFVMLDERMSTKQAQRVIIESGLKNKDRSAALDRISAAIILESYLTQVAFGQGALRSL